MDEACPPQGCICARCDHYFEMMVVENYYSHLEWWHYIERLEKAERFKRLGIEFKDYPPARMALAFHEWGSGILWKMYLRCISKRRCNDPLFSQTLNQSDLRSWELALQAKQEDIAKVFRMAASSYQSWEDVRNSCCLLVRTKETQQLCHQLTASFRRLVAKINGLEHAMNPDQRLGLRVYTVEMSKGERLQAPIDEEDPVYHSRIDYEDSQYIEDGREDGVFWYVTSPDMFRFVKGRPTCNVDKYIDYVKDTILLQNALTRDRPLSSFDHPRGAWAVINSRSEGKSAPNDGPWIILKGEGIVPPGRYHGLYDREWGDHVLARRYDARWGIGLVFE